MENGSFTIEEADIVKLESCNESRARSGWVNVGTHAVWICLDEAGNLQVEVNARCNEGGAIKSLMVSIEESKAHGGTDPDV